MVLSRPLKYGLVVVLLVVLVVVSYSLGRSAGRSEVAETGEATEMESGTGAQDTTPAGTGDSSVADSVPESGFTVSVSTLPPSQQSVLRTLGYDETITFTPVMVSCAEEKLGTERVAAIKAGAAPTVLEVGSLLACL